MQPRFENIPSKTIVGTHVTMSFIHNKTGHLWQSFMPRRTEIKHQTDASLYSIEIYPTGFFDDIKPTNEFEKWAGVEVSDGSDQPNGMERLTIPAGLYAVFTHRGPASAGPQTYQYIFGVWLPGSEYEIDERPHFALMDEKYKHEQPDSEEDIYIPVKSRQF
ncbi:GyrI-like domain-containing protein [Mucilaginibacter calamicampi]|uniref:GyrI-like domain-containing protein n=1 Tax=Mucilaginibacter calamicampi TaxID=1302352 RepID=A0ABW2YWQ7_9SPHI